MAQTKLSTHAPQSAEDAAANEKDDAFDQLLILEQKIMDIAFESGQQQGRKAGAAEGWGLGWVAILLRFD